MFLRLFSNLFRVMCYVILNVCSRVQLTYLLINVFGSGYFTPLGHGTSRGFYLTSAFVFSYQLTKRTINV